MRCLFTELVQGRKPLALQSPQDNVVELDDYSSPPTFASVMLKLSPWQEREEPSVFSPISDGNITVGFYGHKCIAKASSAFITNTFGCPEESLFSKAFLQPPLPYFIASIIHRTRIPYSVISTAHVFLQRYHSQIPLEFDSSKLTAHRLFMASTIYAVQEHWPENGKVFDNNIWSKVSNFTARDIEMMLDHFYDKLNGKIGVSSTVFGKVIYKGETYYQHGAAYPDKPRGRTLKIKVLSLFYRKKQRSSICTMDSCSSDQSCWTCLQVSSSSFLLLVYTHIQVTYGCSLYINSTRLDVTSTD